MSTTSLQRFLAAGSLILLATPMYAAIYTHEDGSDTAFGLTADVLGASAAVTSTGGFDAWSHDVNVLKDNSLGASGNGTDASNASFAAVSATSITYTFDTSTNTHGYDITGIQTYAGWTYNLIPPTGRSNQGYAVEVTYVGGATATLLAKTSWANDPIQYWTRVTLVDATNPGVAAIATGVKSITFTNFDIASTGSGPVAYREIDIYGTATAIPEPASIALLALGGLCVLRRRR